MSTLLLPTHSELLPGATRAARDLLAALAEVSIVVIDADRAVAALAEIVVTIHIGASERTAREIASMAETAEQRVASTHPASAATFAAFADMVRRAYAVPAGAGERKGDP